MRELDILLQRYLERRYEAAPNDEKQAFRDLLTLADPELAAYLLKAEPYPEPLTARVISHILDTP